ncbi:MAG: FecCD family ABC transporter permease [Halanaerobium sp.]
MNNNNSSIEEEILEKEKNNNRRILFLSLSLVILIIFAAVYSVFVGASRLELNDLIRVIFEGERGMVYNILWNIRLPAILTALSAGMGLALAGVVMQSILKNPLASPFTLGISHAAAFGAAFAIVVLDLSQIPVLSFLDGIYLPAVSAFVFSQLAVIIVLMISKKQQASRESIVLAGIALSSLFTAGTTALEFFADDLELASVIYWTFGDPGRTNWNQFFIILAVLLLSLIYFIYQGWNYGVLNSGDELAASLGVDSRRLRLFAMTVSSILTAVIISFVGVIGFIGLVTPHMIRKIAAGNQRQLFLNSALAGGLLLIIADNLARTLFRPVVLPVGVLTAFLGAPLFIYLIIKGRQIW